VSTNGGEDDRSLSLSPLAKKGKAKGASKRKSSIAPKPIIEKVPFIPDPPMLPSDIEDAELTETECEDGTSSVAPSGTTTSELGEDDEDEEDEDEDEDEETSEEDEDFSGPDEEDEEWEEPAYSKTPRAKRVIFSPSPSPSPKAKSKARQPVVNAPAKSSRVSKLVEDMDSLQISTQSQSSMAATEDTEEEEDESFDLPVVKKKKRWA